jgi:monofunctional biosynthetic peptidoglycan transglycosylase
MRTAKRGGRLIIEWVRYQPRTAESAQCQPQIINTCRISTDVARRRDKPGIAGRIFRWIATLAVLLLLLSVALVLPLRWIAPPTTAFMLQDESGRVPVLYEWAAWPSLGANAPLAVVAAEDQTFAEHFGFDLKSIEESVRSYGDGDSLRGASTITQQVAKNLYLWPGRSFVRKGIEAWFALLIEAFWTKQRILEVYLNVAEFGPGLYGVPAASRVYFGKPPAALSNSEAALLAAVLPNPRHLDASRPSGYLQERQRWIERHMQRMHREAWLTRI